MPGRYASHPSGSAAIPGRHTLLALPRRATPLGAMLAGLWLWLGALAPAWALETVTLQLKWSHAFQFAGYYAAVEKGYYREAGLDVRLREVLALRLLHR